MKKTIFKLFMATAVIAATSSVAVAQDGRFSIGAELALPMGDFGDASSIGFGGSVRYEHPVGDNIGLTGTVGYLIFGGKETSEGGVTFDGPDYSMIPIQVGGKYYFTEQQLGFYAGLELGVHSTTAKIPSSSITIGGVTIETPEVSTSSTDLSYAPQIGYHLANLDLGLRYQIIATEGSSMSYLGLRIAYVFGEGQ